jgi:hypothetical protein
VTDLRQGVAEAQHEILDYVEALRHLHEKHKADQIANYSPNGLTKIAIFSATKAGRRDISPTQRRNAAVDAAARLILAVELLDAEIVAEGKTA